MDGDIGIFVKGGPSPGLPLEFRGENSLLLGAVRMSGFL